MNRFMNGGAILLLASAALGAHAEGTRPTLSGEYVEARTCNVYTGACHANGELVTTGREAILAWHINTGTAGGVRLDGLNVVAIVASDENLGQDTAARKTVLFVDAKANAAQRDALRDILTDKYAKTLGRVVAVKSAPVSFAKKGLEYSIKVPGTATVTTTRYACEHCVMTHELWYSPLVSLKDSLVAKAAVNEFKGTPELSTRWLRTDENSSFVGNFAF